MAHGRKDLTEEKYECEDCGSIWSARIYPSGTITDGEDDVVCDNCGSINIDPVGLDVLVFTPEVHGIEGL